MNNVKKIFKKIVSLLIILSMCISLFPFGVLEVSAVSETDRIKTQISETYSKARSEFGKSFNKYCASYVQFQLSILGITSKRETGYNGNGAYAKYANQTKTSSGYNIKAYPGKNVLQKIVDDNGGNVYNIMVCFDKSPTAAGKVYGHVLFIHAIIDGKVYYSESFASSGIKEGACRIKTIKQFNTAYNAYTWDGAIHFYKNNIKNTYSFNFNANGGTTGSEGAFTAKYGEKFTILNNTCTHSGYSFEGWNVKRNNDSTWYVSGHGWCTDNQINSNGYTRKVYNNNQTCTFDSSWITGLSGDGSYTFYAIWKKSTYTISYNANGGSGAPSAQTKTHGSTLMLSSTIPTRDGYAFLGWSIDNTATSAMYSAGSSYMNNGNATLYAVWSGNKYTVSYNSNGGSNAPSSQIKYYGQGLTLASDEPTGKTYTVTFNGNGGIVSESAKQFTQTFSKWNTKADGSGMDYYKGGAYSANASATLYAQWNIPTLNIKNPTRDNYYFLGWYDSIETNEYGKPIGNKYSYGTPITKDVTLYAMWSTSLDLTVFFGDYNLDGKIDFITDIAAINNISLGRLQYTDEDLFRCDVNADGVVNADDVTLLHDVRLGKSDMYSMPAYLYFNNISIKQNPYKTVYGYGEDFDRSGLILQANYTNGTKHTMSNGYVVTGYDPYKIGEQKLTVNYYFTSTSLTVTVKAPQYNLYYNANGGIVSTSGKTVAYNSSVGDLPIPTKEGYTFLGWSYTKDGADYITSSSVFDYMENKTLYAQWSLNTYTVSYESSGGTNMPKSDTTKYLSSYTIDTVHIPTKLGYTFCGYSTNKNSTTAEYAPGDTLTITNDIVLYAVWDNAKELQIGISYVNKPNFPDQSLVYKFNPSEGGNYVLYSECAYDISCEIHDDSSQIECADDDLSSDFYHMINLLEGKTYYFLVKLSNGMIDDFVLTFERVPDECYIDFVDPLSDGEYDFAIVNKDDTIILPSLSHTDYVFRGWSFNEDGSGPIYAESTSIKVTSSIKLYAVWGRESVLLLGDLNGDGTIDAGDAVIISRYDAGEITLTADQLKAGDINGDGVVDAGDAVIISRYDAGLISTL